MLVDGADETKLTDQLNKEAKAMKARHEDMTGVFQAWESAALARQRELHATARSIGGDLLPLRTDQDAIEAIDRHYQRRARGGTA